MFSSPETRKHVLAWDDRTTANCFDSGDADWHSVPASPTVNRVNDRPLTPEPATVATSEDA